MSERSKSTSSVAQILEKQVADYSIVYQYLNISRLQYRDLSPIQRLKRITKQVAPALTSLKGVGPDVASTLLLAAGDNPERLLNERSFASLCGVSPVQASSGKIVYEQEWRAWQEGRRPGPP